MTEKRQFYDRLKEWFIHWRGLEEAVITMHTVSTVRILFCLWGVSKGGMSGGRGVRYCEKLDHSHASAGTECTFAHCQDDALAMSL